ncbi:MAG: hypothetical protein QM831_35710 [Kofleriaceae bacterium]
MSEASDLRAEFDRGFAIAPPERGASGHELLRIELAGEPAALVLASVTAIHVDLTIVPVPATSPALLGIAAIHNALVPIYDLRVLRGTATDRKPRWVALAGESGFAFDGFLGHVRVDALPPGGVVSAEGRLHVVIDLSGALR